ncbi:hypothetical protein Tco_1346004 [Tanacetum coccineum]
MFIVYSDFRPMPCGMESAKMSCDLKATALSLSQNISMGSCTVGTNPRSPMKFFSTIASFEAHTAAFTKTRHVESATYLALNFSMSPLPHSLSIYDLRQDMLMSTHHAQSKGDIRPVHGMAY